MRYKTMGRTGVLVSVIGLGGNQFGTNVDAAGAKAIIDKALEAGINFIDTAQSYGRPFGKSEEILGKVLAGRRHDIVLCTKTGNRAEGPGRLTRKRMIQTLDESLARLGTDYIDVFYLHFPEDAIPLEETMRVLDDFVRAGKIRYPALSNYAGWQVAEASMIAEQRGWSPPVIEESQYNLLDRSVEAELIPACLRFGVSFVPYLPLAGGFLTGKYQQGAPLPADTRFTRGATTGGVQYLENPKNFEAVERYKSFASARGHTVGELAIAWLASQPAVCSVIAGITSPAQLEANVKAAAWLLSPEDLKELA